MKEEKEKCSRGSFSRKRLSWPVIIIFTLAIIFAILGFVDMKANAAELTDSSYLNLTYDFVLREDDSDIYDGWIYTDYDGLYVKCTLDANTKYALLRTDYNQGNSQVGYKYQIYCYDDSVTDGYKSTSVSCVSTPSTLYIKQYHKNSEDTIYSSSAAPTSIGSWVSYDMGGNLLSSTYAYSKIAYSTNVPVFTSLDNLSNYLLTGDTSGQLIVLDTSNYFYNSEMPVPTDIQLSRQDIHTTGDDALTRFLLYSWNNTSDEFYIEMETQPYMAKSEFQLDWGCFNLNPLDSGLFASKYVVEEEYVGSWEYLDIYEPSTSRQMYRLSFFEDKYAAWVDEIKSNNYSILDKALGKQISDGALINLRIRYVDPVTRSYGNWCSLIITKDLGVCLYVQDDNNNILEQYSYEKGFYTVVEQPGTQDNIVDSAVSDSVNERQDYYDEYSSLDSVDVQNSIDVQEATTWLQTVISFIKNTPQLLGAVIVFLPSPILYGIYVIIFLGVIAAGIAIIRALI